MEFTPPRGEAHQQTKESNMVEKVTKLKRTERSDALLLKLSQQLRGETAQVCMTALGDLLSGFADRDPTRLELILRYLEDCDEERRDIEAEG
jgi:hypothetical protein